MPDRFHRLEARFDGRPTLLILDEAWLFLDQGSFAAKIREWLKTLRKFNVAVVFATQSLADIARSSIAPALIESCPTRVFLPNPDAQTPQIAELYQGFGLNPQQIRIIANATPKREYYYQSMSGNRLFTDTMGQLWNHLRRAMREVLQQRDYRRQIWTEHDQILRAIAGHDADGAAALARAHLANAAVSVQLSLPAGAADPARPAAADQAAPR